MNNSPVYPLNSLGEKGDEKKRQIPSSVDFSELEKEVLDYWEKNDIFKKSLKNREKSEEFVFYDGPPFANGLPHYGHLLTGYVKDVIPRFQTMKGRRVDRRFGWDTHGLPAELEAMRELGITSKDEIEKMGIDKFNAACEKSVLKYTDEWKNYVNRQARWVDFENQYKTLDLTYMESVIWAFKELYKKGLAYEGFRVLPYCWQDETPLSNHELRMDDEVYQDRQDNTVTIACKLQNSDSYIMVWTTTPWTLPTNFAVAVGEDIDYVEIEPLDGNFAGKKFILGKDLLPKFEKEFGENPKILKTFRGSELVGEKYYPIFDYFTNENSDNFPGKNAWTIYAGDFVTTTEGTGLVHLAPYGEDDMVILNKYNIKPVLSVNDGAVFTKVVSDYEGQHVFDANNPIVKDLRDQAGPHLRTHSKFRPILVKQQSMSHSYPHCWRCRKPLIYKPVSSWFVKVTAVKDKLLNLNKEIRWIPENVKDGQFGKWLENARDWSISRNRYWGSPIPVWVSSDPNYPRIDVYGSLAELENDFGVKVDNLHRPFIDSLTRPNPDDPTGKSVMKRIEDVFDCWFESGSMPFASVHYPFENQEWFEQHYPSDFIVEYIGQTRGWFYTMHVLAGALFDCQAFKNCLCHGLVRGSDGQKMSKSLRNYPDVFEVFNKNGSDSMRWFLLSSSILKGGNLSVTKQSIFDAARTVMLPFWSSYYFFTLYANAANSGKGYRAEEINQSKFDSLAVMDKYILIKTNELIKDVDYLLSNFEISDACEKFYNFLDILTNWYIRTSRDRFWNEDANAFDTLYTVLENLARLISPLLPLEAEAIWTSIKGGESVHLQNYPESFLSSSKDNAELVEAVDKTREAISAVHYLRKKNSVRVRQPLKELTLVVENPESIKMFSDLICDELNIKYLKLQSDADVSKSDFGITDKLIINARALGPRIGKAVQDVIKASKEGNYSVENSQAIVKLANGENLELNDGEYTLESEISENESKSQIDSAMLSSGGFAVLDLSLDSDLLAEGIARDLIRDIQEARKNAGLDVADRINLELNLPENALQAAKQFSELITKETLSKSINFASGKEQEIRILKSK
ncbi:MAG: isoleucine--tRNA ligase [Bifidobacteriaceae bacterium]|jgi:isoleucyl-tRNA synthetase|nr:isoleucine--tRNA ligase [Bifidobacteriaceae bacterium]